jgi:hypothetical protein
LIDREVVLGRFADVGGGADIAVHDEDTVAGRLWMGVGLARLSYIYQWGWEKGRSGHVPAP